MVMAFVEARVRAPLPRRTGCPMTVAGSCGAWPGRVDPLSIVTCIELRLWTHGCMFVAPQHIASRVPHLQLIDL
ncbi:hypothetical protein RM66_15055 [Xanthomonas phaseoli pv. phaseoli]|uniref:Uncharacterized protein n=1 Tax=Xanthomonas campestris pv. phaseoli TaxID=317013 RepID=A0AB34QKL0_XANCH|nr:hypothetical protein PK63_20050 [Xanthomonas phaseoli pv. phaseoli]KHD65475.1 hypothetical protein PK68_03470 [Xanthomonas phaseoli pv. phaseoli]KHS23328.1 hypothetical protein RM66_15055 [Xanthomonas phaseoli pv. phaseoli]KHS37517.1 hypothetical protein RN20_10810 [Xanthomonas phaseoli pv. phaseoli]KII98832.1 hypothetical protein ST27_15150 [Xanthomonas phaseoli pv. phaseoli]